MGRRRRLLRQLCRGPLRPRAPAAHREARPRLRRAARRHRHARSEVDAGDRARAARRLQGRRLSHRSGCGSRPRRAQVRERRRGAGRPRADEHRRPDVRSERRHPGLLHAAAAGDRSSLDSFLASVRAGSSAPAGTLSQGLHASTLCTDLLGPWGTSATPLAVRQAAVDRALSRLPSRAVWPFDRRTPAGTASCRRVSTGRPRVRRPRRAPERGCSRRRCSSPAATTSRHRWSGPATRRDSPPRRLVVVPGAGHSIQSRDASGRGLRALADFSERRRGRGGS